VNYPEDEIRPKVSASITCPRNDLRLHSFEFSTKPQTIPQIESTPARPQRVLNFLVLEEVAYEDLL
jgi:hypothetical protein